jgi:hypothetical protein
MEKIKLVLVNCLLLLLYSCGSSEDYQGKWKAVNLDGDKYEITFLQKKTAFIQPFVLKVTYLLF